MHGLSVLRRWAFTKTRRRRRRVEWATAGGRRGHPVGLVGVLRGRLMACMARPCYAVGRLQKHVDDVCGATEALQGGCHGRPVGLVGVLRGSLMACMARPCYAVGRLQKHASDVCGANVRRRGNFSRSVLLLRLVWKRQCFRASGEF